MTIPRSLAAPAIASLLAVVAGGAPDQPAPAKTHVLFMGADLSVQRDKQYYRVEDVVGSELMIRINRKEIFVPTRFRSTGLKVDHDLKLASTVVELAGLESGPGYTPGNDPRRKFDRESGAAGGAAAVQDLAYGQMIAAGMSNGFAQAAAAGPDPFRPGVGASPGAAGAQAAAARTSAQLQAATGQLDMTGQMRMQEYYNTGSHADRLEKDLAEANYDALEASFKISSPVELDDPYMVVVFRIMERDALPGTEGMLIYAKSLDPITPKPRYIRVREGGMPVGFRFIDCRVHIYNRGQEVATNVSSKRVDLTRDEAREYILLEHIGANRDTTVPAKPAPGGLRPADRQRLTPDQLGRTSYVKVAMDGTLLAAYADEACSVQLEDPAMIEVLSEVFYRPALVKGKPVEGVARVRLSDQSL